MNLNPEDLQQAEEMEKLKKIVLRKILTKDALERLGRLRLVKAQLSEQLELYLLQLYQSGQIKTMIDDSQLKKILESISNKKKFKIIR